MFSPEGQTGLLLHRVIKLMVDKRRGSNYEEVVMSSLIHRRSNSVGMVYESFFNLITLDFCVCTFAMYIHVGSLLC